MKHLVRAMRRNSTLAGVVEDKDLLRVVRDYAGQGWTLLVMSCPELDQRMSKGPQARCLECFAAMNKVGSNAKPLAEAVQP
jgi:hypothetical protein